jgi:uncharacterized protein YdaU (DUF1376 family)
MHYFQFEIKEWVANTAHLSLEEEAVYLRLINYYYDSERAILEKDIDLVLRKCRISNKEMALSILSEYFDYEDEAFHHVRCEKEIAKYRAKSEQASKAGKASAQRRINGRSTSVQPIINHKSLITNQKPIKSIATPSGVDASLWEDYLKIRKAAKKPITETALKGLIREADKAKMSISDVLQTCCENSWIGFKADWLNKSTTTQDKPAQRWDANIDSIVAKGKELGILPKPGETEGQYRERVRMGRA